MNAVIHACARARDWRHAVELCLAMPTLWGCNTAIGACQRALRWQGAVALLAAMPGRSVEAQPGRPVENSQ